MLLGCSTHYYEHKNKCYFTHYMASFKDLGRIIMFNGRNASSRRYKFSSFSGQKTKKKSTSNRSSSGDSTISMKDIEAIVDRLNMERCRDSTRKMYYRIWKLFNNFFLRLDSKPNNWEQRLVLFTGFLVHNNLKSGMVRSYISAIRGVLREIGVKLQENDYLLSSLTKACKLKNDPMVVRLPIHKSMLGLILKGIDNLLMKKKSQPIPCQFVQSNFRSSLLRPASN